MRRSVFMLLHFVCLVCLVGSPSKAAEPVVVFAAGENGYASIRIPAVLAAKDGTLLAFAEGRARPKDQAENDIILKRSSDGGKTWGPLQVVADFGKHSLNNPCPVVDQKTGRILLPFQWFDQSIHEFGHMDDGCTSTNTEHSFLTYSDDHGATWSKPRDVTCEVKHLKGVTTIASGPGISIQLARGPHAGRILIPFNEGPPPLWQVYAAYSDDGGATWKAGENAKGCLVTNAQGKVASRGNEVQFVELSDGSVRLNARNYDGSSRRTTAVSRDGGETWSAMEQVPELIEPVCQASILRIGDDLYYSGPHDPKRRANGVLFVSRDDGATWTKGQTLAPAGFAYSCLVALPGAELGCLYETDGYKTISFLRAPRSPGN